ncbi:MAG: hypothetical protein PHY47_00875 [Lachnospiraceae bacterium]|nr:hypothetical protein [Lachnospiraceae bacterium]
MRQALLLVGPICSGKTTLANKLIEKKFIKNRSNFYSIEQCRYNFGDGQMSGEFFAWANFLQSMEHPPVNDNAIYEFSGTGRNVFNVAKAIEFSSRNGDIEWIVAYCLAGEKTILERFPTKQYDAPCPYPMDNPKNSLEYMNNELKKTFQNAYEWNGSKRLKLNLSSPDLDSIADEIMGAFQ